MDGIHGLATGVAAVVKEAIDTAQRNGSIQTGYISGTHVQIGTQRYPYVLGVDINVYDGARVYCQLTAERTKAVVVGA